MPNSCTTDYCDPTTGCQADPIDGKLCDDGLVCTTYDRCSMGVCEGQALPCDDGNDCTNDSCGEPVGCLATYNGDPACELALVIETPARGVTLDAAALDADGRVPVTGYLISPADQAPSLSLNGEGLALSALPPEDAPSEGSPNPGWSKRYAFATSLAPQQAMNLLDLEAGDAFDQVAERLQSFYYSGVYYPFTGAFDSQKVPKSVAIGLSQDFLDDNDPEPDDLSGIVQLIFNGLDLMSLLDNPVASFSQSLAITTCKYDIDLNSMSFTGTGTDLTIRENGLGFVETISGLDISFRLNKTGGNFLCPGSTNGSATASSVVVDASLIVEVIDGELSARVDDSATSAVMNNLDVSVDSWFLNLILGLFQSTIEGTLEDAVVDAIKDQVQPMLGGVFDAMKLDMDLEIPSFFPGGDAALVALQTEAASVEFVPNTSMLIVMDGAVLTEHKTPYSPLGSLGYANCLAAPFTENEFLIGDFAPINIGLFDDLVNQILHAIYDAGVLEMTLGPDVIPAEDLAAFGVTDMAVALSAMLPPVITSCKPAPEPDALLLEFGDLGIDASFKMNGVDVAMTLFASLSGAARFQITTDDEGASEIGISILGFHDVKTDIVSVDSEDPAMAEIITGLIDTTLVPMLLESLDLGDAFAFPLPVIDLSSPDSGIPEGTAIAITPEEIIRSDNANTIIKGSVAAPTP